MRVFGLFFAFALLQAQPTISTFAGTPPPEGSALNLNFGQANPSGIAQDSAGNIYFAILNTIYKVTPGGDATRYAGSGWATGSTGDGAAARDTRLFAPVGPKIGPNGNLYFVETGKGNAIRMVEASTGLIRTSYTPPTVIDGSYARPEFDFDVDGALLVTRSSTQSASTGIHRVNPQSGALTLVVQFARVGNFTVEPVTGDLYVVSDQLQLSKVTRATGAISDISPNTLSAVNKIRALGSGELLLIGDVLRRYTVATRTLTPVAGSFSNTVIAEGGVASQSGFQFLDAVPRAGSSEYTVAWLGPQILWRIDTTGRYRLVLGDENTHTIPGNLPQATRLKGTTGLIALPEGGGVVDIDDDTQFLRLKLNQNTAELYASNFVYRRSAMDSNGNLYLYAPNGIFRLDRGATQLRQYAPPPPAPNGFPALTVAPNGDLLFAANFQPVVRWNGSAWVEYAPAPTDYRFFRGVLRCNAEGDLFYLSGLNLVRFRVATKTFEAIKPIGELAQALYSDDFDIDANSNIYLAATNDRLLRIDAGTNLVTTIAGGQVVLESGSSLTAKAEAARFIAVDRTSGDVYFEELGLQRIRRITGVNTYFPNSAVSFLTGSGTSVAPTGSSFNVTIGARTSTTQWQAVSDSSWITFGSSGAGTGPGSLTIVIATNTTNAARTGTVRIGDQVFTITQEAGGLAEGLRYFPVSPCRVADTRNAPSGPLGQPALEAKRTRDFPLTAGSCGVPPNARAYALNITVVPKGPLGYLTVWPAGQPQPVVSTLNALDGRVKANAAIVPAGTNSAVSLYATDATEAIIDITGYFALASGADGLEYQAAPPCRAYDSRLGPSRLPLRSENSISIGCIPLNSNVVFPANFTAIPTQTLGYLALFDRLNQPSVSVLNAVTGTVTANMAILSSSSSLRVFLTDDSHLVVDVNGVFTPAGQTGALRFYPVQPCRVVDTRLAGQTMIVPRTKRDIDVPTSGCGIPSTARAYSVNATVVPTGVFGFLTLWPAGQALPTVSTLNAVDGAITSNAAIVQAGINGSISAYHSDSAHLLIDINGYFAP